MNPWVSIRCLLCTFRLLLVWNCVNHNIHRVSSLHQPTTIRKNVNAVIPHTVDSEEVLQLASRFETQECKQSIARANYSHWMTIMRPENPAKLGEMQQTYYLQKYRAMYIRNQKVASNFLVNKMAEVFNTKVIKEKIMMSEPGSTNREIQSNHHGPPDAVFTVVGEPLKTAVSAYMEVSARNGLGQPVPEPQYRSMPCGTREKDMARLKAFLRAIHLGEPLGPEAFHVFPQALKVDVDLRRGRRKYDFIAKLENLTHDLDFIAERIGVTSWNGLVDASKGEAHSHSKGRCRNLDMEEEELALMLCDLYMADYICFGYELPIACRVKPSSTASKTIKRESMAINRPNINETVWVDHGTPIEANRTSFVDNRTAMADNGTSMEINRTAAADNETK